MPNSNQNDAMQNNASRNETPKRKSRGYLLGCAVVYTICGSFMTFVGIEKGDSWCLYVGLFSLFAAFCCGSTGLSTPKD